jgi:hypothetical protein
MNVITKRNTEQPILTQLELLEKEAACIKENLFNWVVEMEQWEFTRFCCEIESVYRFWDKYRGLKVSDDVDALRPFKHMLPRVELIIETDMADYDKRDFYRWLQDTHEFTLQDICVELESLWDQALENINSYIIDPVFPAIRNRCSWWELSCEKPIFASETISMLKSCKTKSFI